MDDFSWLATETRVAERRALWAILITAFVLRVGLALCYPGIAHPDEVFQYQEPAHRLLTGMGIVTWEWVWHVRSWLIPGLVMPVMEAVRLIGGNSTLYWSVIACLMSALSLPVVWVAFAWGREQGGRDGGIIAGAMAALSFQFIYYSAHLLMDTVAADLLLPALFQCRAYRQGAGSQAMAWGASLISVICYVRPQFIPPMLLPAVSLLLVARKRGETLQCLAWGLGPFLALGGFDWITLGRPFQSIWLYIYVNLVKFPHDFAAEPFYWYFKKTLLLWSLAVPAIAWFCWKGSKQFRLEFVTAILIVLLMSVIHHKENRFVLAAYEIFLILAGVGMGMNIRFQRNAKRRTALTVAAIGAMSLLLALFHPFIQVIRNGHTQIEMIRRINRDPQACGVYIMQRSGLVGYTGYTGMRDGIIITSDRFDTPRANLRHANYILIRQPETQSISAPLAYVSLGCEHSGKHDKICLLRRPGGCDGGGASTISDKMGAYPDDPIDNL